MNYIRNFLLLSLVTVSTSSFASLIVITDEDFEGGAAGWSNNSTDNTYPATFTEFLGRFGASTTEPVTKTFPVTSGVKVTITFDFYEIDSWDYEDFRLYVNGGLVSEDDFKHNRDDGPVHGLPKILPGDIDGDTDLDDDG